MTKSARPDADVGDIQLGDVQTRAIEPGSRPDQDRDIAVVPYGNPNPEQLRVYIAMDAFADIETHASSDTSVELGGVLLGKQYIDNRGRPFVVITDSLRAKHYQSTLSRFTYTHDTFSEITREKDTVAPDLDIVGWYHTHPGWDVFLSSHDTFIHENFFAQPLDVAYVVDPVKNRRGFFAWQDGMTATTATHTTPSHPSTRSSINELPGSVPASSASTRALPELSGFFVTASRHQRAGLEELVSRTEGRRPAEPAATGSTASHMASSAGGSASPAGPIFVQTPAPAVGSAGVVGGRALVAGMLAILCMLVLAQTALTLAVFQRSADPATLTLRAELARVEAENRDLRKQTDAVADLRATEARLAGEREMFHRITADLRLDGKPFEATFLAKVEEADRLRARLLELENLSRAQVRTILLSEQENARLTGETKAARDTIDKLNRDLRQLAELERNLRDLSTRHQQQTEELERFREQAKKFNDNREKLTELAGYESSARLWFWVALAQPPLLMLLGLGLLTLLRRTALQREKIADLNEQLARTQKALKTSARAAADQSSGEHDVNRTEAATTDPATTDPATTVSAGTGRTIIVPSRSEPGKSDSATSDSATSDSATADSNARRSAGEELRIDDYPHHHR